MSALFSVLIILSPKDLTLFSYQVPVLGNSFAVYPDPLALS
jgi:hypothetical protein